MPAISLAYSSLQFMPTISLSYETVLFSRGLQKTLRQSLHLAESLPSAAIHTVL